jgi:hypothetical protein
MHFRRFAAFLAGAWLAGCLFMDMVATQNFRSVDRLLAAPSPQLSERIQAMGGHDAARMLLRHQVAEQNRWYFQTWEQVQIALAIILVLVLFAAGRNRWMLTVTCIMLGSVLVMHFFLTPEITRLGRVIDFVPPDAASSDRARFWTLHGTYSGMELIKLGLGLLLAVLIIRRRQEPISPA